MNNWFEVDRRGLAQLLERRGKGFAVLELLQNAWDQNTTCAHVSLCRPSPESRDVQLIVADNDPEGFADLSHAFTLFAESNKKGDPGKRGRFNLGEKLVLALCSSAEIATTTGTIRFDGKGRTRSRRQREEGSQFRGLLRMTNAELEAALELVSTVIPPKGVHTTLNGKALPVRTPVVEFEASLPTEIADAEGCLRRVTRKCGVEIYEPLPGESASIYELGVPVVETGDRFHVNVMQKVPLNMDRDNVPPAYLRTIRTLVLNHAHASLPKQEMSEPWVKEATSDPRCEDRAFRSAIEAQYGEDCVAYDPSDREANKAAAAAGRTVVTGGAMSKGQWENAKRAGLIRPAGQVFPTPRPYSPHGAPLTLVPESEWTAEMHNAVQYCARIAQRLIGRTIEVRIANEPGWGYGATFGPGCPLTLNLARLGRAWFHPTQEAAIDRLLIHELAHETVGDHLSHEYHRACCDLGARLKRLALDEPDTCRL